MGLTIVSSNRVETLQQRLVQRLAESPLPDPFSTEIVVVPTFAMGRWLNLRLARQLGIAANIDYPQPAPWLWGLAASLDDEDSDLWTATRMTGWIFNRLPALLQAPAFATLASYLSDDRAGLRRWQLAQRIADGFDRYQTYQPQRIAAWDRGEEDSWQARLWRDLGTAIATPHRVAAIAALAADLDRPQPRVALPPRISLFALPTLPPLYLDIVIRMARHSELEFFLHSPTEHYWADLETARRRARRRLAAAPAETEDDVEHELLGSWGRLGQHFQDLLLENEALTGVDVDRFDPPSGTTLLGQLQRSIFTLEPEPLTAGADGSICIHVCHSAMRECEVLVDELLELLEDDTELGPEDILVMVPDIETYAPYLEAVFENSPLACNISDVTLADEHPMLASFLRLLELPDSRFKRSDILALLDDEAIARRFELGETDIESILHLIDRARTRWGIDPEHRSEVGLPPTPGNTWSQARERFFAGFALADDTLWQDISPLPGWDETEASGLGRFWHFIDRLDHWRRRLAGERSAAEWRTQLSRLLEEFFDPGDSRLQQIRDAIGEILELPPESRVSRELLLYLIARRLRQREQQGQLYSGGVTICGMRPMRAIPFGVICLLGMNDRDFPRRDPPDELEFGSADTAFEPGRRDEDRYLMLETLLSARRRLYLSYTGRSLRDDSDSRPSALLQELVDFIRDRFRTPDGSPLEQALYRQHPMQVFSPQNFCPPAPSYQAYWRDAAQALAVSSAAPRKWPRASLAPVAVGDLDLSQLKRFVRHPVQFFYQQRLGIYLDREAEPVDDEAFALDTLERWQLKRRLAEDLLEQRPGSETRLLAEGLLAHGQAGRAQIDRERREQADWFEALESFRGRERRRMLLDLRLPDGGSLAGSIDNYYPGRGLLHYEAGKLRGKHRLQAWIDHLALCAGNSLANNESSLLLATDRQRRYLPLEAGDALERLIDYCELLRDGLRRPLPVLPESSFAWASADSEARARASAWKCWLDPQSRDAQDAYLQLVLQAGFDTPIDDPGFADCAGRLYSDLLAQEVDA